MSVLPYSIAKTWCRLFKEVRQSTSKEGGPEVPVTALTEVNINTAAAIVREDRRITLQALSEILQMSLGATHMLVTKKIEHVIYLCVVGSETPNTQATGCLHSSLFDVEGDVTVQIWLHVVSILL